MSSIARPSTASSSARPTGPGRRIRGGSVVQSTTVDSMPRPQGPPSRMRSMRLPRPSSTWPAVVGESCMERLALGAASGRPSVAISRRVSRCSGQRRATVGPSAVTLAGIRRARGTMTVTGPGQRLAVICSAACGHVAARDRAIAVWPRARSVDCWPAGPSRRRYGRRPRRRGHRPPGRRPFRWEWPRGRPSQGPAQPGRRPLRCGPAAPAGRRARERAERREVGGPSPQVATARG